MEALAEVIESDARAEMELEPAGRLEFEDVSFVPGSKPREIVAPSDPDGSVEVFYQVGKETTTVSGRTILLKDVFPEAGCEMG